MVTNHVIIRAYQRDLYTCRRHGPLDARRVRQVCAQPNASKSRLVAILSSSWRGNNRQVKTDERGQPFGAVGRSIQCARYCSIRRPLSSAALGSGVSDILPRFPQIISQQGTVRSKVEATMRKRVMTPVSQN